MPNWLSCFRALGGGLGFIGASAWGQGFRVGGSLGSDNRFFCLAPSVVDVKEA